MQHANGVIGNFALVAQDLEPQECAVKHGTQERAWVIRLGLMGGEMGQRRLCQGAVEAVLVARVQPKLKGITNLPEQPSQVLGVPRPHHEVMGIRETLWFPGEIRRDDNIGSAPLGRFLLVRRA